MLRLRRFFAVLLLALWLPATLHCGLEAAGLDEIFHCDTEHQTASHDEAARDGCDVVENGLFKPAANTALLAPPALHELLIGFVVAPLSLDLTPPDTGVGEQVAAPPEVARTWHFVARAAPPPRAPSVVS